MIQDVDATLQRLLLEELSRLPEALIVAPAQITFSTPVAAEAEQSARCRLNLYLHDVRENLQLRDQSWALVRRNSEGTAGRKRPPVRLDLSYLVTAHMPGDPATEHRMLSDALGVLLRFPYVPEECLAGSLQGKGPEGVLITVVQPDDVAHMDGHNLWRVLGGSLRPSISIVVTTDFDPFETKWTRVVREAVLGLGQGVPPHGPRRPLEMGGVRVSAAGVVTNSDGQKPLPGAVVAVEGREERATADSRGFWYLLDLPPGPCKLIIRRRGYRAQELQTVCPPPGRPDQLEPLVVRLEEMTDAERSIEEKACVEAVLNEPALVELERVYTVSLSGRLRYPDGRPAAFIPLRVGRHRTTSDADGVYTFHDLPPGEDAVVADLPGFGEVPVKAYHGSGVLVLPEAAPNKGPEDHALKAGARGPRQRKEA